jgi:hypothetical protein
VSSIDDSPSSLFPEPLAKRDSCRFNGRRHTGQRGIFFVFTPREKKLKTVLQGLQ